ncbi:MAG: MBL fold metallo-hydrolase [Flavobacteriales bacterium]|nr:MBL fold metallo-hydrolase [Flavobacteriales bacterium]|tara:strand:+ start:2262 stop:3029 length:768 start_codon:yes stop_codon:yes gene_type:complete
MKSQAVFLGTGTSQGVPVIGCNCLVCNSSNSKDARLRSSLLVLTHKLRILIDIGPDFRAQMLKTDNSYINAIILTHQHRDHTAGLDDIRPIFYLYKKPIEIYSERNVSDALKSDFRYLFDGTDYPGKPQFIINEIKNATFYIKKLPITPIRVMHYKLPVFGYRIADLAYVTDANYISESEKRKLLNLDILIINSLQKEKHISHYSLEESLDLIKELRPKKAYLTHISHCMGLHDKINKELPKNVFLAYDNLKIAF